MWTGLSAIDGVRLFGPGPEAARTPTVAFTVANLPAIEVTRQLATHGVFASNGDFYATTVVARLGQTRDGLVRAGCACYTTAEEVERMTQAVAAISGQR